MTKEEIPADEIEKTVRVALGLFHKSILKQIEENSVLFVHTLITQGVAHDVITDLAIEHAQDFPVIGCAMALAIEQTINNPAPRLQ